MLTLTLLRKRKKKCTREREQKKEREKRKLESQQINRRRRKPMRTTKNSLKKTFLLFSLSNKCKQELRDDSSHSGGEKKVKMQKFLRMGEERKKVGRTNPAEIDCDLCSGRQMPAKNAHSSSCIPATMGPIFHRSMNGKKKKKNLVTTITETKLF